MEGLSNRQKAVELLQQFGLKEYEARCLVALSQLPKGTARDISEASEVPRTRVYDAIRVLESKGLVEVQHSSPQQFRAVPTGEAIELLRREYESRAEKLGEVLEGVEPAVTDDREEVTHEVWTLTGPASIENRTEGLVGAADREVVLVVGRDESFTDGLTETLAEKLDAGVDVILGAPAESLRKRLREALPEADVFASGLEWLDSGVDDADDRTTITRLLLVDRSAILVSSVHRGERDEVEKGVFGRGFENGIVVIARRMMATGLARNEDPGRSE
jgi:sugar-specific transcriptional regulator TrmB